jgi:hypothetical protein
MPDEKPKTVTVEAIQPHSYQGKDYEVGDTYDIEEQYADSVASQGKAVRTDRVARAKAEKKAGTKPAKAAKAKRGRPAKRGKR